MNNGVRVQRLNYRCAACAQLAIFLAMGQVSLMDKDKSVGSLQIWFFIVGSLVYTRLSYYLIPSDLPGKLLKRELSDGWEAALFLLQPLVIYLVCYGVFAFLYSRLIRYKSFKALNDSQLFNKISQIIWFSSLALLVVLIFRSEPKWLLSIAVISSVWGITALLAFFIYKRKF